MSITGAHVEITDRIEAVLKAVAIDLEPTRRITGGQAYMENECRYCGGTDGYSPTGEVAHTDRCIWAAVHDR